MLTPSAVPIIPESGDQKTTAHKTIVADRWLIWIDTVEIVVGRDLRRNDADLDASLNAYLNDESALDYANSIRYPSAVSAGLLRLLVCLLAAGVVTVGVLAWFRGGR